MMGSKKSAKIPSEKKDEDEAKKTQQQRMSWKLKYELINSDQHVVNGSEDEKSSSEEEGELCESQEQAPTETNSTEEEKKTEVKKKQKTTVLAGLSGYLSTSDSEDSDSSDQGPDINTEVRSFLKEIESIKLDGNGNPVEPDEKKEQKPSSEAASMEKQQKAMQDYYAAHGYSMPTCSWQECYDSSSGYSYYWNMETNEVRWEMPSEYQSYITTVKQQWEEYNRALYANQYRSVSSVAVNQSVARVSPAERIPNKQIPLSEKVSSKESASVQRHSQTQTPGSKTAPLGKMKRKSSHQSDSEDEKIELITSYGPNSDDQSSEEETSNNDNAKTKRRKRNSIGKDSKTVKKSGAEISAEEIERQEELRRKLASRQEDVKKMLALKKEEALKNKKRTAGSSQEGPVKKKVAADPEVVATVANAPIDELQDKSPVSYKPDLPSDNDVPSPGEMELVERLKSQAEVLKQLGGELPEGVYRLISDECSKADKESSLVPGYEEDNDSVSDDKETVDEDSSESRDVKSDLSEESSNKPEAKENTTKVDVRQVAAAGERVSKKVLKLSAKAKQLINASETTKRARQTDFVNTPLGLRPASSVDLGLENDVEECSSDASRRVGFGYSGSSDKSQPSRIVRFVSGGTTKDSVVGEQSDLSSDVDIEGTRELLLGKMKFLSEGKEAPSPVQIWAEQLEILYKAWETKCLKDEFLGRWLQNISERLTQLESSAAPPGWLCLWSREERRYCYKRVETGEVVWDFPTATLEDSGPSGCLEDSESQSKSGEKEEATDLGEGQGEIEMDLCMTPPPPSTPPSPPPPPIISDETPSTPPPPVISYPTDNGDNVPPLPVDMAPPLPEEAPPPLPEEAPPLPLDEVPPLPPGEPLPPGVEPTQPELSFTPPLPPCSTTPPLPTPPPPPPPPPPPSVPQPHRTIPSRPHPQPQEYAHLVMTPASYHPMAYHPIHYAPQPHYPSAYVSAAPMPAPIPTKPLEPESKPSNLSSELDSFYSDLATLDPEETDDQNPGVNNLEEIPAPSQDSPDLPPASSSPEPNVSKKRKKTKLAPGLALKKKGVSSLVAKWQKVQLNSRRDF